MVQVSHLSLNIHTALGYDNARINTTVCTSTILNDIPTSIGFSKQEQRNFITPPCNYKLR